MHASSSKIRRNNAKPLAVIKMKTSIIYGQFHLYSNSFSPIQFPPPSFSAQHPHPHPHPFPPLPPPAQLHILWKKWKGKKCRGGDLFGSVKLLKSMDSYHGNRKAGTKNTFNSTSLIPPTIFRLPAGVSPHHALMWGDLVYMELCSSSVWSHQYEQQNVGV